MTEPTAAANGTAPLGARIAHEAREIGIVTLYFLVSFLLFLSLKKLLLEQYDVRISVLGTAFFGALVVGKVVVLLGKTSFGNRFHSQRLVLHVLWRSLAYTGAVFLVTAAERLFHLYRELGSFGAALNEAWAGRNVDHFLAMNLCLALSFLVHNVFDELDRHLGEGGLRRFFLDRRRRAQTAGRS